MPNDALFPPDERAFRLPSSRPHPGIFVSHFYVLRSLDQPSTQIQRRIVLRRGLNILWANPNPTGAVTTRRQNKIAGHTAGKSTFCRLIRYVLGESSYGTETLEGKIGFAFPNGWVVLRIELDGQPWIAGRSFADKNAHFAARDLALDDFLRDGIRTLGGYRDFLAAIEERFVATLPRRQFPGRKRDIQWRQLLPWYTRDQEARLLSLTTWRGLIGKTQSPQTDSDDRQFLMRLVLDLMPAEEADEFDEHERLNELKKECDSELPRLDARVEQAFSQLSEWVEISTRNLEAPLLLAAAKKASEAAAYARDELLRAIPTKTAVGAALDAWHAAARHTSAAAEKLKAARQRVADLEKQFADCDAQKIEQQGKIDELSREVPDTVCGLPIGEACAAGKRHHEQRPTRFDYGVLLQSFEELARRIAGEIVVAKADLEGLAEGIELARSNEAVAKESYEAIESKRREALGAYHEAKALQAAREKVVSGTEQVLSNLTGTKDLLAQTTKDIRESLKQQELHRVKASPDLRDFSSLYERMLRCLLGDEINGAVEPEGRALHITAEGRNDLDSGAITAAKLISFDLAAMAWSMEGRGAHPRFLIHDSPREADMAEEVYHGLFAAALALERSFPSGIEPNFQYIVTTTAQPPDEVKRKDWLLDPVLNALDSKQRILAVDL
jgi:exonuclease VII small subunit